MARSGLGRDEIVRKAGVGHHKAQLAIKAEEGRLRGLAEAEAAAAALTAAEREEAELAEADVVIAALPEPRRLKALAAIERYRAKLERDIPRRVAFEVTNTIQEEHRLLLEMFGQQIKEADDMRNAYRGIFTAQEYKKIWSCLHLDSRKSVTDERLNEAFDLLTQKRHVLTKPEPAKPVTLGDLDALLTKAKAAKAAKKEARP
jgi:hypothetical protein